MRRILKNEFQIQALDRESISHHPRKCGIFNQATQVIRHYVYLPGYPFLAYAQSSSCFEKYGLKVTPAPIGFYQGNELHSLDFYPSSAGIERTRFIWSEALGLI
jgi:hypothetical protein